MASRDQWAKFLATPGAKSTDPEFNPPKSMASAFTGLTPEETKALEETEIFASKRELEDLWRDTPATPPELLLGALMPPETKIVSVRPDFSTSILSGTSSGVHRPFAKDFVRHFNDEHLTRPSSAVTTAAGTTGSGKTLTFEDLEAMMKAIDFPSTPVTNPCAEIPLTPFMSGTLLRQPVTMTSNPSGSSMMTDKLFGMKADKFWVDELNDTEERNMNKATDEAAKAELEALAAEMTAHMKANPSTLTLTTPASLTVLITTKGYSKVSHIGGEEFVAESVYLGKKGKLIATFKAQEAVAYQHMEMPLDEALTKLSGFADLAESSCEGGYQSRMNDVRNSVSRQRDAELLEEKASQYESIGFGTW